MSGTVNISRGIWSDTAFKPEPFTEREAFMWMIMEASYKPREKRIGNVTVQTERGQLATSVRFMSDAWGWSKSRVDRFLNRIEKRDMIKVDSGTGINVITICKYSAYQSDPGVGGTPSKEKRDSSGTAAGQQRDKPNKGLIPDARRKEEEAKASLSPDSDARAPRALDEATDAVAAYNAAADSAGWPQLRILSPSRRAALKCRLRECGGLDGWRDALERARGSPHLCGQNERGWTASFDFLTRQSSFAKLMEGNYDPRDSRSQPAPAHRPANRTDPALEQIARLAGIGRASGDGGV